MLPLRRTRSGAAAQRAAQHLQREPAGLGRLHRQGPDHRGLRVRRLRPGRPRQLRDPVQVAEVHPHPGRRPTSANRAARRRWISRSPMPIAPDAQKVVINARPTVEGDGGVYEKIAQMLASADRQFPGAVWSFSIGWGCDKLITAADLAPVRSALADAHANGTTAFNASGDLAGLECKGGQDWSSPPERRRHRARLGRVAARDDRCRRHHPVHRRRRRMAVRTGLVRRAAVAGQRRRGVRTVRPAAVAACGAAGTGTRAAGSPRTSPRWPTSSPASRSCSTASSWSAAAPHRRRRSGPGIAAVMNQYLVENGGRPLGDLNPAAVPDRRRARGCRAFATSPSAATRSPTRRPATTW